MLALPLAFALQFEDFLAVCFLHAMVLFLLCVCMVGDNVGHVGEQQGIYSGYKNGGHNSSVT